jgi:hypothetical protein
VNNGYLKSLAFVKPEDRSFAPSVIVRPIQRAAPSPKPAEAA